MGYGESFYYTLSNRFGGYAYIFAGTLALSGFFFYIFDIDEWDTAIGNVFGFLSVEEIFALFVITVTLTHITIYAKTHERMHIIRIHLYKLV